MKKLLSFAIFFIPVFLCGCSASDNAQVDDSIEYSYTEAIQPASPITTPTHEEKAEDTASLLSSAQDSFQIMNEMAEEESAPEDGVKAAEAVRKKYKSRLEELAETDFSACSDDELSEFSFEISDIITAIREARDLLQ